MQLEPVEGWVLLEVSSLVTVAQVELALMGYKRKELTVPFVLVGQVVSQEQWVVLQVVVSELVLLYVAEELLGDEESKWQGLVASECPYSFVASDVLTVDAEQYNKQLFVYLFVYLRLMSDLILMKIGVLHYWMSSFLLLSMRHVHVPK